MTAPPRRALIEAILLAAILAAALWLRIEPLRRQGGADFDFDRAFHLRMIEETIRRGHPPAIDPLALPPEGKPVARALPTLLYDAAAAFHRLRGGEPTPTAIERSCLLFTALAGALIGLPIYALVRGLGFGAPAALVGAFAAATIPAHVHRTAAPWLRYDALGSLLTTLTIVAVTLALAAAARRRRLALTALAAFSLVAAVAAWRVPLALVGVASGVVLIAWLAGRWRGAMVSVFGWMLPAPVIASFWIPYLAGGSETPFVASRLGVLSILTGMLVLGVAVLRRRRVREPAWPLRALTVAVLGATAIAVGAPATHGLGEAVRLKLGLAPQFGTVEPGADFAVHSERAARTIGGVLLARTSELRSPRPSYLVDADYFALLLPLAALYAAGRALPRRRPWVRAPAPPGATHGLWFFHLMVVLFIAATLMFARTKVLAAPLLALYPALFVAQFRKPTKVTATLAAVAVIATSWTAAQAVRLVRVLPTRMSQESAQIIEILKERGRPGDVVLCDWGRGYAVQTHCRLPTVTDGFLESIDNRRRIAGFAVALYSSRESDLAAFCREFDVRFVWVPGRRRHNQALYAGVDINRYFRAGRPTAAGAATNYAKLLAAPGELRCFRALAAVGADRLLEYVPDCDPGANRD